MIQLGATVLNPNMIWVDRDQYSGVFQDRRRTVAGTQVIWWQQEEKGRPITLQAIADQGWLTKTQKDAVLAMAASGGSQYSLVIGANTYTVMFRHDEPPAVSFDPLISRAVDLSGDYFIGEIRLFTV